jgi:fructose-bisphosphate aldolase, class I
MERLQMNAQRLIKTAKALVADDKGLLAMDESNPTCNQRFAKLGIPQTEEMRRTYRELIVTTPGLSESISGAILYDETIRQRLNDGTPFANAPWLMRGSFPASKSIPARRSLAGHPGEKITEGLDGLRDRLAEYSQMGARFAKWRAVIAIGEGIPTRGCIEANAHALARYAALCQEAGLVPVIEPETLMEGAHTLERCGEVTEEVLRTVFNQLYKQGVMLEGMILKPNMVLPGSACPKQETVEEVADATIHCLLRSVPAAVPGIAFLSGGQSAELASARLNAMNVRFESRSAVGGGVFVCPRHSATGIGDLAGSKGQRYRGTGSLVSPRALQPGRSPGRIQSGDGKAVNRPATYRLSGIATTEGLPMEPTDKKAGPPPAPGAKSDAQKNLKSIPMEELQKKLGSSPDGLSQDEAKKRLAQYGPNAIAEKKENPYLKFLTYFWGPIPWMIEGAVILSGVVRHWPDFFIILLLLLSNAVVGFWEEHQAGDAIAALASSWRSKPKSNATGNGPTLRRRKWCRATSSA